MEYCVMASKRDQVKAVDAVREYVRKNWPAGTYFEVRQGLPFIDGDGLMSIEVGAFDIPETETCAPIPEDFGRTYRTMFLAPQGYYLVSREVV